MSAIGFIIAVLVMKVVLDLLSATRRGARTDPAAGSEDTSAIDALRNRQAWAHHDEVTTGNLPTEQYSSAAGSRSVFDD